MKSRELLELLQHSENKYNEDNDNYYNTSIYNEFIPNYNEMKGVYEYEY